MSFESINPQELAGMLKQRDDRINTIIHDLQRIKESLKYLDKQQELLCEEVRDHKRMRRFCPHKEV